MPRTPRRRCRLPGIAQDSWAAQGSRADRDFPGLLGSASDSWAGLGTLGDYPEMVAVLGAPGQDCGLLGIVQDSLAAQDSRAAFGTPGDLPGLPGGAADSQGLPRTPWQLRTPGPCWGHPGIAQYSLAAQAEIPGSAGNSLGVPRTPEPRLVLQGIAPGHPGSARDSLGVPRTPGRCWGLQGMAQDSWAALNHSIPGVNHSQ